MKFIYSFLFLIIGGSVLGDYHTPKEFGKRHLDQKAPYPKLKKRSTFLTNSTASTSLIFPSPQQ
jgi:hypothetical protein